MREFRKKNPELIKEIARRCYLKNKTYVNIKGNQYYKNNAEKMKMAMRNNYYRNKMAYCFRARQRKIDQLMAMPSWVNKDEIYKIYVEARSRSLIENIEYHVDHIYPLRNKIVCGLHVPWNLRVITAEENLRKRNKIIQ